MFNPARNWLDAFKWVWAPLLDRLPMVWCALDAVRIELVGHGADAAGPSSRRGFA